jgi:IS1 family transposase
MISMNRLSNAKRAQVVGCLVEGMGINATTRITGVAKNTVLKLLLDLGEACSEYQDGAFTNLNSKRFECDEIWSFCHNKDKNTAPEHEGVFGYGDVWTWVAIEAETKLVPTWLVGERGVTDAMIFIADLATRLKGRIQITTDGLRMYIDVIDSVFQGKVDYATLHKLYGKDARDDETKYSPAKVNGTEKKVILGNPDMRKVSTSYVERQNLTMRMGMRRFTRLTNAFSKKIENHTAAVAIHFAYYNLCRPHQTLKNPYARTPAMAAGIEDHVWTLKELVGLLDKKVYSN